MWEDTHMGTQLGKSVYVCTQECVTQDVGTHIHMTISLFLKIGSEPGSGGGGARL